jgi:hypothetical protein
LTLAVRTAPIAAESSPKSERNRPNQLIDRENFMQEHPRPPQPTGSHPEKEFILLKNKA